MISIFSLFAIFVVLVNSQGCDHFTIRRNGDVIFGISSEDGNVMIPHDLEVGAIMTNSIIIDDYRVSVDWGYDLTGAEADEPELVVHRRKMDPYTGAWVIPRVARPFAINATHVIYNNEFRDVAHFGFYELRDFLEMILEEHLDIEHIDDVFQLQVRFDPSGHVCSPKRVVNCLSLEEELLELVSSPRSSDNIWSVFASLRTHTFAGEPGYSGMVQEIHVVEDAEYASAWGQTLENEHGVRLGEPRFRLADEEVDDVFVLEAVWEEDFEITFGVVIGIYGWRGGQVHDFGFENTGGLNAGHVVVGPHPMTDPSDVVEYNPFDGWSGLEVRSPGPALRFTEGHRTRVYVYNSIPVGDDEEHYLSVEWTGLHIPHDQTGSIQGSTHGIRSGGHFVYEFEVSHTGSTFYSAGASAGHMALLVGPVAGYYDLETSSMLDREYIAMVSDHNVDGHQLNTLNGNSYPATLSRMSGWYNDILIIERSTMDDDGNYIIHLSSDPKPYVDDKKRQTHVENAYDCPAYGGPIIDRPGLGCMEDGVHQHIDHQITSMVSGQPVIITDHVTGENSLNGVHYVTRVSSTAFKVWGTEAPHAVVGEGGFVRMWKLHKSDPENPQLQNNGASGAYYKFNYGENVSFRMYNSGVNDIPLHLHGHTFHVMARDGNMIDLGHYQSSVNVASKTSVDVLVHAEHANEYGAWIFSTYSTAHLTNPSNFWPDGALTPGGIRSWVDYTGFHQGGEDTGFELIDDDGDLQSVRVLPPDCRDLPDEIFGYVYADSNLVRDYNGDIIYLSGESVEYPTHPVSGVTYGEVDSWQWASENENIDVDTELSSSTNPALFVEAAVTSAEFEFVASGINSFSGARTSCSAEFAVHLVQETISFTQTEFREELAGEAGRLVRVIATDSRLSWTVQIDDEEPFDLVDEDDKKRAVGVVELRYMDTLEIWVSEQARHTLHGLAIDSTFFGLEDYFDPDTIVDELLEDMDSDAYEDLAEYFEDGEFVVTKPYVSTDGEAILLFSGVVNNLHAQGTLRFTDVVLGPETMEGQFDFIEVHPGFSQIFEDLYEDVSLEEDEEIRKFA